ncbi:MAG: hypothetical protein ACI8RZ_002355 [Myxococcota bacterium]|jgi:hypothetical protein
MMRAPGLLMIVFLLTDSPAEACEQDASTAELRLVIEEAEAAYIALDVADVTDRLAALDALTPCLDEALPRPDAARYHRIQGLGAFIRRDREAASQAFLSARSIEPDAALPSSLVPPGHPVQLLYASLPIDDQEYGFLPEPAGSYLLLDGRREEAQLPLSRPFVFQRIESSGAVAQTAYLWPGDPLPSFAVAPPSMPGPIAEPTTSLTEPALTPHAPPRGKGLVLASTGLSAAATGAFLMLNRNRSTYYNSDSITLGELDETKRKVNRYGAATLGATALTLAGGVSLAVVW